MLLGALLQNGEVSSLEDAGYPIEDSGVSIALLEVSIEMLVKHLGVSEGPSGRSERPFD